MLGSRQSMCIRRLGEASPRGLSAPEVDPDPQSQPNTYLTLDRLRDIGLVIKDESVYPRRYWLAPKLMR